MSQISPEIIELFDRTAHKPLPPLDELLRSGKYPRGAIFRDAVVSRLAPGSALLDYGCGRGHIAVMAAQAGYRVEAMDPSPESIKEAQRQAPGDLALRFGVLTGFGESLATAAYDGIVCSSVIEFVQEATTLLGNFHRALKPGGMLFISFANRLSLWRAYAQWRFGKTAPHFQVPRTVWTGSEFRQVLHQSGFADVRVERYFECQFDRFALLRFLGSSRYFGTLGFVSAVRPDATHPLPQTPAPTR